VKNSSTPSIKHSISVVTPVYGCKDCLPELHRRLTQVLSSLVGSFEIIMVNDGCEDGSWDTIQEIGANDSRVKGINLSRNFGQHYAIAAGLEKASGEWVVVMDCDLQDQPEEIEKLYKAVLKGFDIVFAKRTQRQDSIFRRFASKIFYKILGYMTETQQDHAIANFGIYNHQVIVALRNFQERHRFFPAMVRWAGFHSTTIEVDHAIRSIGGSSYNAKKMIRLAIDTIISFSDKPLRLTAKLGLLIVLSAFGFATYVIYLALNNQLIVAGWASIMVSIWLLFGLALLFVGIIGIYISKTFDESKKRPIYIVKETINI